MSAEPHKTTHIGFLLNGKDFVEACEALSRVYPDNHPALPNTKLYKVRLYLLGHALELLCKAILLNSGVSIDELKSKYGHNLKKLYGDCKNTGCIKASADEEMMIKNLSDHYFSKDLEYHAVGAKTYLRVNDLLPVVSVWFVNTENIFRDANRKS